MNRPTFCAPRVLRGAAFGLGLAVPAVANAGLIDVVIDAPVLDRWMYAFNQTPGTRTLASSFGATGTPLFDDRDGQMIVRFDTAADVPPARGLDGYVVRRARLVVEAGQDMSFIYDDTQDSYRVFLPEDDPEFVQDEDPGEPLELFGLGYRAGFDRSTFAEDSPYTFGDPIGVGIRNAFAAEVDEEGGVRDVSNTVTERYDPQPWAVGLIATLTPGELVPEGSVIRFDLAIERVNVHRYLREALDAGRLDLAVTSFTRVEPMGGEFPSFYTKENDLVLLGFASAARLELEVELVERCVGDIDGSGTVDFGDVLRVLAAWGPCTGDCPEDLDGSATVDFADVLVVLGGWGVCP